MGLAWDLAESVFYHADTELQVVLEITVPEAGVYYLIGALYIQDGSYIPGTIFGVVVPEGSELGVVSVTKTETWSFAAGESMVLPCKLVIDRTGVVLGLFLMKMTEESASLEYDVVVDQVSASLNAPTAPIEVITRAIPALLLLIFFSMIVTREVSK